MCCSSSLTWWLQAVRDTSNDLFRILADPTRRHILDLLAERGPLTVGQLAAHFPDLVSSGISKHLMGLRAKGFVSSTRQGRQQTYRIEADAVSKAMTPWLVRYEPYWSDALERLRELAEGDRHSAVVELSFRSTADVAVVWSYFTEAEKLREWHGDAQFFEAWPGGRVLFRNSGWPAVEGTVTEVEAYRLIRWSIPSDGSEILELFEPCRDGTRVSIEQHGIRPAWPPDGLAGRVRGWDEAVADLVLILDHGVHAARHMADRVDPGMSTLDVSAGAQVETVVPKGPADIAGLHPGDVILKVSTTPVYRCSDLTLLWRSFSPGKKVAVQYVRDRKILTTALIFGRRSQ